MPLNVRGTTIFMVPVDKWSDVTPDPTNDH
jgi:hypothetical protein